MLACRRCLNHHVINRPSIFKKIMINLPKLAVTSLLLFAFLGWAQQQPPAPSPDQATANLPTQPIGVDDLLAVSVYGAPELSRTVRVSPGGEIRLPMLQQKIKVTGILPGEVEEKISKALADEQLFVNPVVTVHIAEYKSRPISVAGAVKKPLTFQAFGTVTLLDAITRAEGLTDEAGAEILVSRTQPGENGVPKTLTQRIPVKSLIDLADPEVNLKLTGGEEIRVPDTGKVFVVGNVKKPGAFKVEDATDTTVLKVLAQAEGLLPYAQRTAYIYRKEGNGAKNEIPIQLESIMKRKAPDVPLSANDILYIPDNTNKRMTLSALDRLATFGAGTMSGVLIWRTR